MTSLGAFLYRGTIAIYLMMSYPVKMNELSDDYKLMKTRFFVMKFSYIMLLAPVLELVGPYKPFPNRAGYCLEGQKEKEKL